MPNFIPKDYVGVNVRIDQMHEKYKDSSITTQFDIKDETVVFTAVVTFGGRSFTGHSFGQVGKEKAFEKLETVAVGRALAFAGFETQSGIASKEEMEVWDTKKDKRDLGEVVEDIRKEMDVNALVTLKEEGKTIAFSEKQKSWLEGEFEKAKKRISGNDLSVASF